jgi:hypothetical protein
VDDSFSLLLSKGMSCLQKRIIEFMRDFAMTRDKYYFLIPLFLLNHAVNQLISSFSCAPVPHFLQSSRTLEIHLPLGPPFHLSSPHQDRCLGIKKKGTPPLPGPDFHSGPR